MYRLATLHVVIQTDRQTDRQTVVSCQLPMTLCAAAWSDKNFVAERRKIGLLVITYLLFVSSMFTESRMAETTQQTTISNDSALFWNNGIYGLSFINGLIC